MTDNKEIPQEVRDAIEKELKIYLPTAQYTLYGSTLRAIMADGYLLSQQALEEKDKRIRELEDALQVAVIYEERTRKVMCDVNKEFGFKEPEQLKWVKQAISVLPPKTNHP